MGCNPNRAQSAQEAVRGFFTKFKHQHTSSSSLEPLDIETENALLTYSFSVAPPAGDTGVVGAKVVGEMLMSPTQILIKK